MKKKGERIMSMALYALADCDAHCKTCGEHFVVALHGEKCPKCSNENPEKINVLMGGSLGHEEPASLQKFQKKEQIL